MRAVILIGGGIQEVRAVEIAQSTGYKVIVTDRNPDAPCFPYADYTATIDGRDIEGLIAYTLLNKEKLNITGVFTLTEMVTSVAAVASACDLPGVSLQSAVTCQNKQLCKEIWIENNIPTPKGGVVSNFEEAKKLFQKLEKRIFVKPLIGFGGQGAQKILNDDKLKKLFKPTKYNKVLMEELINGSMHDVNGLIDNSGNFHPMGIVDRYFLEEYPVEEEIRTPSELTVPLQNQLYHLLEISVRSLGINWGPVKGDVVLSNEGIKILEVAPRLHGPKNSLYLLPFSGFNCLKFALSTIAGDTNKKIKKVTQNKYSICSAILPNQGSSFEFSIVKEIINYKGIEEVLIFFKEGDMIRKYKNSTDVPAYIFSVGANFEECRNNLLKTKLFN